MISFRGWGEKRTTTNLTVNARHTPHASQDMTFGHLALVICNVVLQPWPQHRSSHTNCFAGHSPPFCGDSSGMTSCLETLWTTLMQDMDTRLDTTDCVSPAYNLQLSGNGHVAWVFSALSLSEKYPVWKINLVYNPNKVKTGTAAHVPASNR